MTSLRYAVLVGLLAVGCGSTPPPRELLDARAAYKKAEEGKATKLNPAQLHEAKVALDTAEKAFEEEPEEQKTKDLAYVAQRKAEWANALGGTSAAVEDKDKATKELSALAA